MLYYMMCTLKSLSRTTSSISMHEVQQLLSIEQFCQTFPHSQAALYSDPNSVVLHCSREILVENVVAVVPPPRLILHWNTDTDTFNQISSQVLVKYNVHKMSTFCKTFVYFHFGLVHTCTIQLCTCILHSVYSSIKVL